MKLEIEMHSIYETRLTPTRILGFSRLFESEIVSKEMNEMMSSGTREQIDRLTQALLPMKKLDLAVLRKAYAGE